MAWHESWAVEDHLFDSLQCLSEFVRLVGNCQSGVLILAAGQMSGTLGCSDTSKQACRFQPLLCVHVLIELSATSQRLILESLSTQVCVPHE